MKVHYEVVGSGKDMVLLHGWGVGMQLMEPLQKYFARHYRVLSLDLPGFFESEAPPQVWGSKAYAIWLHDFLNTLGMESPIIIAHSFGARIALQYALLYPVNVMILTGAAGIRKKRNLSYYYRVYRYKLKKKLGIVEKNAGSRDYQNASGMMRQVLVKTVNEDLSNILSHIETNTLLVWGSEDQETPLNDGKKMKKEMKNATLVVMRGDDHFAYYHQMSRFIKIIEAFLEEAIQ